VQVSLHCKLAGDGEHSQLYLRVSPLKHILIEFLTFSQRFCLRPRTPKADIDSDEKLRETTSASR
jgi:hypothetical protein